MLQRMVVCLLVALPMSFPREKQKRDKSNDIREKGDSFFSQTEGPNPQTCEKHGRCEVSGLSVFRNPLHFMFAYVILRSPFGAIFELIQIKLANFLMFPFQP